MVAQAQVNRLLGARHSLSGPVGWVLIALGTTAGIALLGRADWKKCAVFVIQMHLLKVQALQAAGVSEKEIFGGK
jgi:hypothetical protein